MLLISAFWHELKFQNVLRFRKLARGYLSSSLPVGAQADRLQFCQSVSTYLFYPSPPLATLPTWPVSSVG